MKYIDHIDGLSGEEEQLAIKEIEKDYKEFEIDYYSALIKTKNLRKEIIFFLANNVKFDFLKDGKVSMTTNKTMFDFVFDLSLFFEKFTENKND